MVKMETICFVFFLKNFIVHIPLSLVTLISHDSQQAQLLVTEDTLLTTQIKFWCQQTRNTSLYSKTISVKKLIRV